MENKFINEVHRVEIDGIKVDVKIGEKRNFLTLFLPQDMFGVELAEWKEKNKETLYAFKFNFMRGVKKYE